MIPTKKSEKEAKTVKENICIATNKTEKIYHLLKSLWFWKFIWIAFLIDRFLEHYERKEKFSGPVKINETEKAKVFWIKTSTSKS